MTTTGEGVVETDKGLYCPQGDFYIDPWRAIPRAVVTHAHSDHFAFGCGSYLIAAAGETVFRNRLGSEAVLDTLDYGEARLINGVRVSLHPAGHILGSAQVRIEIGGYITVITGDYKIERDRTCAPFEVVACDHFITEATFGLPIYHWQPQTQIFDQINAWWQSNADAGKASVLYAYALGKAQRIIANVDPSIGSIYTHGAVESLNTAYRAAGIDLPPTIYATAAKADFHQALVVAPISADGTAWTRRFGEQVSAFASGWMRIRGARRRRAVDRGFVLSDHVDWDGLLQTIKATGAQRIGVTHGYTAVVAQWLRQQGMDAYELATRYRTDIDDAAESIEPAPGVDHSGVGG